MENEKYYLGLDIGTDSVGYAVTSVDYSLKKYHGEPVWGVHLFDEASLNSDRRGFRTARRRLNRRQQRVDLIQELFAKEINKIDPRFFVRNQSSSMCEEDRGEPFAVFSGDSYTDKEYHAQYPTIHHLLDELMNSDEEHDVRLIYIACAWLVAHRGHFLSDVSKENVSELTDFNRVWNQLMAFLAEKEYDISQIETKKTEISEILKSKSGVSLKAKRINSVMGGGLVPAVETESDLSFKFDVSIMVKLLCGSKIKAKDLFCKEDYSEVQSFSLGDDDSVLVTVFSELTDDETELITILKKVYDWALLVDILAGYESISAAKKAVYMRHKSDLAVLKFFVKKYLGHDKYKEIFSSNDKPNYSSYIHSGDSPKRANLEDFSKYILNEIKNITPEDSDKDSFSEMKSALESRSFLPKQKNTDNRVIPYQLYAYELEKILNNAGKYLDFLNDKDSDGITNSEKIKSVFEFRVPYFVGPLNQSSKNAWIIRKADGKIYPWNFESMVDLEASEEAFIRKLTNRCTYLPAETVLPKDSILYHKFVVLNEINNIRINGESISVETKQELFNDLFLKYRIVSTKKIIDFFVKKNLFVKGTDVLSGIDEKVKSNMKPYHDFKRLLDSGSLKEDDCEKIIRSIMDDVAEKT
ncbi:MAG: type II CRISPR RNA-guided endonuclease Cas9, partial [Clostridia bacterium]|nr:type II CRISPR RNA-guided endonuclease Cas9 [Clostridia bacterium]